MREFGSYLFWWCLGYYAFGWTLHVLDRRYGIPTYRAWYRWTRWKELTEERGWIYEHERGRRHRRTQLISAVQSAFTIYWGGTQYPIAEIAATVIEGIVLYWGFMHGKLLWNVLEKQDQMGEAYDRTRDSLASFGPKALEAGSQAGSIFGRIVDAIARIPAIVKEVVYPDTPSRPDEKKGGQR